MIDDILVLQPMVRHAGDVDLVGVVAAAREADVGVAGGSEYGIIFRRGEVLKKVPEAELEDELFKEIERICDESK